MNAPKKPLMPAVPRDHDDASFSELVPFKSTKINIKKSPLIIFGIATALIVPFLFGAMTTILGSQDVAAREGIFRLQAIAAVFYILLITLTAVFVYSRSSRPFWQYGLVFLAVAVMTATPPVFNLLVFPFRGIIPGIVDMGLSQTSVIQAFIGMFFIAGLAEEWLKAIPALVAAWIAYRSKSGEMSGQSARFALTGPLDGVVMGMFAGAGFIFAETAFEYVPRTYVEIANQTGSQDVGFMAGLSLLLPRVFGGITGHMGYSSIFGYFIGLAVIRPRRWKKLLAIGWLGAALVHAIWNSFGSFYGILQYPISIAVVVFAIAALLKGRQIDAARGTGAADTSGSIIVERPAAPQAPVAAPPPLRPVAASPAPAPAAPSNTASAERPVVLQIAGIVLPLRAGEIVDLGSEPALGGRGAGVHGTVVPHPTRPNVLGLRNSGKGNWTARLRDGSRQMIEAGHNVRLAPGVSIDFGDGLVGAVEAAG